MFYQIFAKQIEWVLISCGQFKVNSWFPLDKAANAGERQIWFFIQQGRICCFFVIKLGSHQVLHQKIGNKRDTRVKCSRYLVCINFMSSVTLMQMYVASTHYLSWISIRFTNLKCFETLLIKWNAFVEYTNIV